MKVFEFTLGDKDWIDWVVAENKESALEELRSFSDMGDEEHDNIRDCRELTTVEVATLKMDPDQLGTGEYDESRAIPFNEAIKGKESEMPFHLCSQID